jgi:hypothetical protein
MFKYQLHEDTKYYLKSLLVEDDGSTTKDKKDTKKSKGKKEDSVKAAEPKPVPPPTPPVNVSGSPVSPTEEEKKKIEADQKRAQEEEISKRTLPRDRKTDLEKNKIDPTYKENVRKSSGGPFSKDSGKRNPDYKFGSSSGRGRGALAPDEPEDRTGIGSDLIPDSLYNFDVLLGQSLINIPDSGDNKNKPLETILEPYKDLQRIKILKSVTPSILQKISAIGQFETSNLEQKIVAGPQGSKIQVPKGWDAGKKDPKEQFDTLQGSGLLPSSAKQGDFTPEQIKAIYDTANKKFTATPPDKKDTFESKVKKHSQQLAGLGGLDPYFGEELAAKLLGGEWIEKTMQNIAPAQERGVVSSMGNRSSIGM